MISWISSRTEDQPFDKGELKRELIGVLAEIEAKAAEAADLRQLSEALKNAEHVGESPRVTAPPRTQSELAQKQGRSYPWLPFAALSGVLALQTTMTPLWPFGGADVCTPTSPTCQSSRVVTAGPGMAAEDAASLSISVFQITADRDNVYARVRLTNRGTRMVYGLSANPLRLSWRLRPSTQNVGTSRDQFFPVRADIGMDVAPQQTVEVPILARIPAGSATLNLVLDLAYVSEGRFWSFDAGVPILEVRVPR